MTIKLRLHGGNGMISARARLAPERLLVTSCPRTKQTNPMTKGTNMEKTFYVYAHYRKSDGRIFYIGKGRGTRASAVTRRSEYWSRVYKKHGQTVRMIVQNVNETCAFSIERAAIAYVGLHNLVNMTIGGEGKSGHVPSKYQREKCSASNKGKKPSEHAIKLAIQKNSKPVGTECGLRFASAAEAGRVLFPHNPRAAKVMISACCNARRTKSVGGYKFGFLVDGNYVDPEFPEESRCVRVSTECGIIFESSVAASNWLKENGHPKAQNGNIIQCCKGRVSSAYGYKWRYA